eukprot:1305744-Rhodomonas_salina.1
MGNRIDVGDALLSHAALVRSRRRLLGQEGAPEESAPAGAGAFKRRLDFFYRRFNPEKLPHLDDMVGAWEAREGELSGMLQA